MPESTQMPEVPEGSVAVDMEAVFGSYERQISEKARALALTEAKCLSFQKQIESQQEIIDSLAAELEKERNKKHPSALDNREEASV